MGRNLIQIQKMLISSCHVRTQTSTLIMNINAVWVTGKNGRKHLFGLNRMELDCDFLNFPCVHPLVIIARLPVPDLPQIFRVNIWNSVQLWDQFIPHSLFVCNLSLIPSQKLRFIPSFHMLVAPQMDEISRSEPLLSQILRLHELLSTHHLIPDLHCCCHCSNFHFHRSEYSASTDCPGCYDCHCHCHWCSL